MTLVQARGRRDRARPRGRHTGTGQVQWYLERDEDGEHWDDQVSFYGARGPLAVKRGDEYSLIDGNHRGARAIITGAPTFRLQAIKLND